jgi:prepilin-type N-terminal cleavage/methylation domain-containing protein
VFPLPVWVGARVRRAGFGPGRRFASSAGYTLTEVLAALAVLGLAIAGLTSAAKVISRFQIGVTTTVLDTHAVRQAQAALDRALGDNGPYRSTRADDFTGEASGFQFACRATNPCSVKVVDQPGGLALVLDDGEGALKTAPLRQAGPAHWEYRGSRTLVQAWPPTTPEPEMLRSVALVRGEGEAVTPILDARLWVEHPSTCVFDAVHQDCR